MQFVLIQIETTTKCNARCLMCPRPLATRSTHSELMDESVFWLAVEQAVGLGVRTIVPLIDGEPLTDPRMVDFIEQLAKRYPQCEVGWYTNGSLLTPEISRRLLTAGNIHHFNISMQGGDKATYEHVMGLDWDNTIYNVEQLIALNAELGHPVSIRANMCVFGPTAASVEAFKQRWKDKALICLGSFSNFGGLSHDTVGETPWYGQKRQVCDRATKHLYVYWNGDVGQCCFDVGGTTTYGNLRQQTLSEIVNSPKYLAMRNAHLALDVKQMPECCWRCNSSKFHG